jgi:aspartyl protease family protein
VSGLHIASVTGVILIGGVLGFAASERTAPPESPRLESAAAPAAERQPDAAARPPRDNADPTALHIKQSPNGHFHVEASVDGTQMRLLVDTGATTSVLNRQHAAQAGLFPAAHEFNVQVGTANGTVRAAQIVIRDLRIGDAQLRDVPALVIDADTGGISVLGMTALRRFRSYEVRDGTLTLRW